jgi:predicted enzyme related to lactoylglutathione lyase
MISTINNVFSLGMFVRFAPASARDAHFHATTLGLPLVRTILNRAEVFWGGEAIGFEVVYVDDKVERLTVDHAGAPMTPVFRVTSLDRIVTRLRGAGAHVIEGKTAFGREAYVRDNTGFFIGLRESPEGSTLAVDIEARRRRERGEAYNPGCKSMPEGWQELGWILRRVVDMPRMLSFYENVLELERIAEEGDHVLFDVGDNVVLEVAPGGNRQEAPSDRYLGPCAAVLRVHDVEKVRNRIVSGGGHIVNERISVLHWADLMYCADPEGAVFGVMQPIHPKHYAPEKYVLPETQEAVRREVERIAAVRMTR